MDLIWAFNVQSLIYDLLNWKTVSIPSKSTRYIEAILRLITANNIFDGSC